MKTIAKKTLSVAFALSITALLMAALSLFGAVKHEEATEYRYQHLTVIHLPEPIKRETKFIPEIEKPEPLPAPEKEFFTPEPPTAVERPAPEPPRKSLWDKRELSAMPFDINIELSAFGDIPVFMGDFSDADIKKGNEIEFDRTFSLSEVDAPPRKIGGTPPQYPEFARSNNIEGWVRIELTIDERGEVAFVSIIESSPRRIFDEAVLSAARNWRFTPATYKNKPVKCKSQLTIRFETK